MDTELSAIQQRIGNLLRDADTTTDKSAANDEIDSFAGIERRLLRMAKQQGGGLKAFLDE